MYCKSNFCTFVLFYDDATHTLDVEMHKSVEEHIGKYETLLEIVKRRKGRWFGHVVRANGTLAITILQGKVEGGGGKS